jgi:glutathione S-transferase
MYSWPMIVTLVELPGPGYGPPDQARQLFERVAPRFQAIPGLQRKYFVAGEASGGVYVWDSRAAAEAYFDAAWRQRMAASYGAEPRVRYFEAPCVVDNERGVVEFPPTEGVRGESTLILYGSKLSPWGARCWMQVKAKNLPVERRPAIGGGYKSAEYLALNPIGKIPTLVDGDVVLPESEVICEYLEDKFPTPSLRGAAGAEAARVRLISRLVDLYLMTPTAKLLTHRLADPLDRTEQPKVEVAKALDHLEHFLDAKGPFAAAARLTLADCALLPAIFLVQKVLPLFGVNRPLGERRKLNAWWAAIQRDATAAFILGELEEGYVAFRQRLGWPTKEAAQAAAQAAQ